MRGNSTPRICKVFEIGMLTAYQNISRNNFDVSVLDRDVCQGISNALPKVRSVNLSALTFYPSLFLCLFLSNELFFGPPEQ